VLNSQGFDLWANDYDKTVEVSEENDLYPFAGYKDILNVVFNKVMEKKQSQVLDIGFGTGILTEKLYDNGHFIDGLDFSAKMIAIAEEKMPKANLLEWDICDGLPNFVKEKKYDAIISTYTLHHLSDEDKVRFITDLLPLLTENGKIVIGDIAYETKEKLEISKKANRKYWDEDEFYFVFEEIRASLKNNCTCNFHPISHCGGVLILTK
jgi:putative AdoMet-dependent methyltransferase